MLRWRSGRGRPLLDGALAALTGLLVLLVHGPWLLVPTALWVGIVAATGVVGVAASLRPGGPPAISRRQARPRPWRAPPSCWPSPSGRSEAPAVFGERNGKNSVRRGFFHHRTSAISTRICTIGDNVSRIRCATTSSDGPTSIARPGT